MKRRRRKSKESGGTWICECAQSDAHRVPYQAADRRAASHQLRVNESQPRALKNTPGGRRFGPAQTCSDINVTENSADSCLMGAAMGDKRNLGKGTAMLADAMGRQERRRHPRFLFSASMTVRLQDGISMSGISVDMSTSGLSAMVSGALSEGDTVTMEPVAGEPASARVGHKLGRLYGFEFVDLSAEQTAKNRTEQPEICARAAPCKRRLMNLKLRRCDEDTDTI